MWIPSTAWLKRSLLAALIGLAAHSTSAKGADPVNYLRDIKPLLKERCYACHGALQQKGKLRLDALALMLTGGRHGPAIEPGNVAQSLLIDKVSESLEAARMPPQGKPLTPAQIGFLKRWIAQGALGPKDERPEEDPRQHWAFARPSRPPIPYLAGPVRPGNPIDAFLTDARNKQGLSPGPPVERATLLRRVYLDLIGLPPSRTELHDFLSDKSTNAYEKIVDRLLNSPQYGERWARHWMDVWRYSDWYGRRSVPDVMNSYAQIWRWRDWIVKSLNEDKGYDRMVMEMLAADEIAPTDDANIVATGFLVRNWFKWNYNQWMRDNVEHTAKAFLGLTLNCCHCHDHKYDPITQKEYFQFRAFFEPLELRHERWPGEPDPGPFNKYVYGASYGPMQSGMIRVFDEKPDAHTFMYSGGDERNRLADKPPVPPAAPAILGGDRLTIEPVNLPPTAVCPGLKPFAIEAELAKRRSSIAAATVNLASARTKSNNAVHAAEAKLEAARAELHSLKARIEADGVKYGIRTGNRAEASRTASRAERQAQLLSAKAVLAQRLQAEIEAECRPAQDAARAAAIQQANAQVTAAQAAVQHAEAAFKKELTTYTPLGPVYPATSTGRRRALAGWIASKDNPLTARVAVNHLWSWHFGRPLVETTFNFGRSGKRPSHPELLDWLAAELMDNGWRIKALHRLLVTSDSYRMRSHMASANPQNEKNDPDNRLLWHFPTMRMEAEEVRDSVLHVAAELDTKIGGHEIAHEQGLSSNRRSLYFAHHGESKMEFLELFDEANPSECYRRTSSVLPQQALALSNSELTLRQGRLLARKLWSTVSAGPDAMAEFVRAAFEQALGRLPTALETRAVSGFLARQATLFSTADLAAAGPDTPSADAAMRARENLIIALFNHNDFVTIR